MVTSRCFAKNKPLSQLRRFEKRYAIAGVPIDAIRQVNLRQGFKVVDKRRKCRWDGIEMRRKTGSMTNPAAKELFQLN